MKISRLALAFVALLAAGSLSANPINFTGYIDNYDDVVATLPLPQ